MSDPPTSPRGPALTRRRFLGGAVTLACARPALRLGATLAAGCGRRDEAARPDEIDGWPIPEGTTLAPDDYARLAALFDALVPGDAASPGAAEAHAAYYLDQLLGAFDIDPPRIFAGGPYSGRHGGLDGFSQLQPLTRVEEIRWRTFIEGSREIREREWNGPVVGLIERYRQGLAALDTAARDGHGRPLTALSRDARRALLAGADEAFVALAYEHAVEGTYGDAVYGGNFDGRGWQAVDFEGDRQPLGYSAHQMARPEDG